MEEIVKKTIVLAAALTVTVAIGLIGFYVLAAYTTNVTVPSSGTLVPIPTDMPSASPSSTVTPTASLSIRDTNGATLNQIYWGDHLTVHSVPTYQVMVQNTGLVPLTLNMTATTPYFATLTWDSEGKTVPPDGYVVATLKLSFVQAVNSQTIPFNIDINIKGTSA